MKQIYITPEQDRKLTRFLIGAVVATAVFVAAVVLAS